MLNLRRIWEVLRFNPLGGHGGGDFSGINELGRPVGATKIMLQSLAQNARFTMDGTDPTATVGFQLLTTAPPIIIPMGSRATIKIIEEAATAAVQYQWGS